MIKFGHKGGFENTYRFLSKSKTAMSRALRQLEKYGQMGVAALASATPVDTGKTAASWYYEIESGNGFAKIHFCNSNIQNGVPIAVIIQFGHGTGTGGWVQGRDYINPAIQPIFDKITKDAWEEVTKL